MWRILLGARGLFGVIFFGLAPPAFASATLDALVSAAARFSAAIEQQLVMAKTEASLSLNTSGVCLQQMKRART